MALLSNLAKEATAWKLERKTLKGPQGRDHFIIEPEGAFWCLTIYPRAGLPCVIGGLTLAEANRRRLHLSNDGYVGKIVAGGAQ